MRRFIPRCADEQAATIERQRSPEPSHTIHFGWVERCADEPRVHRVRVLVKDVNRSQLTGLTKELRGRDRDCFGRGIHHDNFTEALARITPRASDPGRSQRREPAALRVAVGEDSAAFILVILVRRARCADDDEVVGHGDGCAKLAVYSGDRGRLCFVVGASTKRGSLILVGVDTTASRFRAVCLAIARCAHREHGVRERERCPEAIAFLRALRRELLFEIPVSGTQVCKDPPSPNAAGQWLLEAGRADSQNITTHHDRCSEFEVVL